MFPRRVQPRHPLGMIEGSTQEPSKPSPVRHSPRRAMSNVVYLDFDLEIRRSGRRFVSRVLNSPAGQAEADFRRPFTRLELENFVLRVGRTGRGRRDLGRSEIGGIGGAETFG